LYQKDTAPRKGGLSNVKWLALDFSLFWQIALQYSGLPQTGITPWQTDLKYTAVCHSQIYS
jgi:hypothetical protein